jgi:biotin carboxylase
MKTALVIGASSESLYAISVAQKRGYHVIAFDGDPEAEGLQYADEAFVADIREPKEVWSRLRERPDLVLPIPIGRYLTTTGAVNDYYGLKGVSEAAAVRCTDKYLFHQVLAKAGLRDGVCCLLSEGMTVPEAHKKAVQALQQEKEKFGMAAQMVVKPRYGSGSRGVELAGSEQDLQNYFAGMSGRMAEDFVVETVFPGIEYGVDAAVFNGELSLFLIREKILTPPPYRQCVGYLSVVPEQEEKLYQEAAAYLQQVVGVLGLNHCLLHCDLMWDQGKPMLIELSGRPSGHRLNNLFTPLATGTSMVDIYIDYVEGNSCLLSGETVRPLLIGYFDAGECTLTAIPAEDKVWQQFGENLLEYDCRLVTGQMVLVQDGHTLMGRGYFILKGKDRKELLNLRQKLLDFVFSHTIS